MIYNSRTIPDLVKAFGYAKRLLETAKFGIIVTITKKKQQRSIKQNRYYRGVIVKMIANEVGYQKQNRWQVHEAMKLMFCPEKKTPLGMIKSTRLLDTAEMEQYHTDIRTWFDTEYHVLIPLPNELPEDFEDKI